MPLCYSFQQKCVLNTILNFTVIIDEKVLFVSEKEIKILLESTGVCYKGIGNQVTCWK
jgi:hypothetical protein